METNSNDELYPIAVLIDELKVGYFVEQDMLHMTDGYIA
jgi:hypothetical protein